MHPNSTPSRQQFVALCECGCGQPTRIADETYRRYGHVKGQPVRFIAGHANVKNPGPRYIENAQGCWVWQRRLNELGYGLVYPGGRKTYAHVWVYEQSRGPVPPGMELDHTCRNHSCVNPDHLDPVSHMVNVQRGSRAKLTADHVAAIRDKARRGVGTRMLATEYGVSIDNIRRIMQRQTWKNVA